MCKWIKETFGWKKIKKYFPDFLERVVVDAVIIGILVVVIQNNWEPTIKKYWGIWWVPWLTLFGFFVLYLIVQKMKNR